MEMSLSKLKELVMDMEAWRAISPKELDTTEWLNWIERCKLVRNLIRQQRSSYMLQAEIL